MIIFQLNMRRLTIVWFRLDLRISDNPALFHAVSQGKILPVYILDDTSPGSWKIGGASRWWLHHALERLNLDLKGHLQFFRGSAGKILLSLIETTGADGVFWNRGYEPWKIERDRAVKEVLKERRIETGSFNGSLLKEPWTTVKDDNSPYKVFTPYLKKGYAQLIGEAVKTLQDPEDPDYYKERLKESVELKDLNLLPGIPWDAGMRRFWTPREKDARHQLKAFLEQGLADYETGRDFPGRNSTSRLSPYLHYGQISPGQIWNAFYERKSEQNSLSFKKEMVWREFAYYLLFHFPTIPEKNLKTKFDNFPWEENGSLLKAWQKGKTGIPLVDAGMRELWQTGQMHNRIRMITASFLVKNLRIHWKKGEKWFWDCLVDADLASNSASWQWVAGSGTDAAPYFRIFNPVTQGEKFDRKGEYTRKYVPELADLSDKYLFKPWKAPEKILEEGGIRLGKDYPFPIVDISMSRKEALEAYNTLKLVD